MVTTEVRARAFFGKIYVSYRPLVIVDSVLAVNGRVLLVSSAKVIEKACNVLPGCEGVSLPGKASGPGFIDSHLHLTGLGLQLNTLDLRGVRSIGELRQKVKDFLRNRNPPVLIARGWDHERMSDRRFIRKYDIDDIVSDRPALLVRICGHVGTLNTYAIKALGIGTMRDNPDVEFDESGEPTGVVREDTLIRVMRSLEPPPQQYINYVIDASNLLVSQGITTVGFMNVPIKLLPRLLSEAGKRIRLRLRLYLDLDALQALEGVGIVGGFGNEWATISGVKVFADGSLGARTALLSEPYSDSTGEIGKPNVTIDKLVDVMARASKLGIDVAIHAIGDGALDIALQSMEASRYPARVEHASLVRDDQLPRLRGVRVSVQPMFVIEDMGWLKSRLGEGRLRLAYRFRSLIGAGAVVGLSTDAPVEPTDPWATIYAAVTRGGPEGCELARVTPNEALRVDEALHLYTAGSAAVLRDPLVGTLTPGSLADISSFSQDPLEASDPSELRSIRNVATFIGGERAY
ncbi:MAG: amidohydrolase [Acidilobus sp.]